MSVNMWHLVLVLSVLLAEVSACPEFTCGNEECLPFGEVCDFKEDCQDGSDEEFCGSCDFEDHSCGWNTSGDTSYTWSRHRANSSAVPGHDHTTGSSWGHMMQIDVKEGSRIFQNAILELPVDSVLALGCSFSFWYHIYDHETFTSSDLTVKMVRGSKENSLLSISKRYTDGWENATVFIGNQPKGYKLQFVSVRPFMGQSDIKLDDILFNNCAEGDTPPASDQLSCNFEEDTCSWYHDYTASLLWDRRKNEFGENNEVTGYHMMITAEIKHNINSTARLVSFPQSAKDGLCVSFWYHIFGNSIGSLKFIAKHPGEEETVVWMRTGTQGNKWRFADLTFQSDKPIQFIIEAVVGGTHGSISIDDIVVSSDSSSSCPAERECTFQGSLCGMQPGEDSGWTRVKGSSLPADAYGPKTDHTLGTDQGFYLSSQLWTHPAGTRVSVTTAEMEPTPADGECLMFWYHMGAQGVGEMNVYLANNNLTEQIPLWSRQGDQGSHWRHGRVTLISPHQRFKVIFEAVAGLEPKGDIAIDDLIVLNDACPPQGFCDFEMDFCGWVNSPPAQSGLNWDWLSGSSTGNKFIPGRDHSLDSRLGHFAFFTNSKPNETARLESELMEAVGKACLEIWHYSSQWIIGHPSDFVLTAWINENGLLRHLWSTNGFMNQSWILGRVDYTASGLHQIVLEATCPESECGSISLDDVHIIRDRSCDDLIPTTPPPPPTTPPPPSAMDCTFEQGLCSWVPQDGSDVNWTLSNGLDVTHPWDGPQFDHTLGNNQGFFLLLNGSGSVDGERASVSVPVSGVSSEFCVDFWFYMSGPAVSSLDLLIQAASGTKSSELLVWTRDGAQDEKWIKSQVNISTADIRKLVFTANRSTDSKGFIAVDDVTVKSGICQSHDMCGFDSGWCGYENDVSHFGRWVRTKATQTEPDHTYRTEHGFYMKVQSSNSSEPQVAQLLTHVLPASTDMCLRFWYKLPAEDSNSLAVHLLWSEELKQQLWESSSFVSTHWEVAEVTVWAPAKFHVVFKAFDVRGMTSTVEIDDVSITKGACGPRGSCDFESGQCTWVSRPTEGGHDWVLSSGEKLGPSTDHTTQSLDGVFLLSAPLHLSHSSRAQVVSEWIFHQDVVSCISLWSFMGTSDSGTLRLHVNAGVTEEDLTFISINSSAQEWTRFSHSLNMNSDKPFQLLLEAETKPTGYFAIDDIHVTPGLCQANDSTAEFVGCSFEDDTCGWRDESTGQFKWVRGRNGTGPSVDNTHGTALGWYMTVRENRVDLESLAALLSPLMRQASANCTLSFYYNMYSQGTNELSVFLQSGVRTTLLWWASGNHGDEWHSAEVAVGRVAHDFRVRFEARTSSGHIAIDDINFRGCSLSEPQPSCPETMFTCTNGACVDPSRVCDFSDDCGDRSDENSCEGEGVTERCSFESGLCFWANNIDDTDVAKWTRHPGQEGWPDLGPPRDHTKNSAAGHYVTPSVMNEQISEILSRTLLPSTNCSVRFFYYSLSDVGGNLSVWSRTQRDGRGDVQMWNTNYKYSYSWQRAQATFSSFTNSKIVFHYERAEGSRGLVAVDDISFSGDCRFDAVNSELPDVFTTSAPQPSSSTTSPEHPCHKDEFYCWLSENTVCVAASAQCNYHKDCPQGEDELGCGPCSFESDQCGWTDISDGQTKWKRQKSSNNTVPPMDHTTHKGYYMTVNLSDFLTQTEARLQSPTLSPSSPYCQLQFHFYIKAEASGSLRVLMQQEGGAAGGEAILWSRSHSSSDQWTQDSLMLGQQQNGYKIWFSSLLLSTDSQNAVMALDDVVFVNCDKSFQPPALSSIGCSFEDGLCSWLQGAEDSLDWTFGSGSTETPNTGPTGDHTTGNGKYLYLNTSSATQKGKRAQLKSTVLPPAGAHGYCFSFWYHMFGPTVDSLRVFLLTTDSYEKTLVWQKAGNQGDEWLLMQSHVTTETVHQLILEATVGGQAGDVAIDDISFAEGHCPVSDVCDFEEDSCGWSQDSGDDWDWIRLTGSSQNSGPQSDHTTNTDTGHYYYLPSTQSDQTGQSAAISSPLFSTNADSCVQLWYHMSGMQVGTLNIYQKSADEGQEVLLFSQTGDQGPLWRAAQAALMPHIQPYRIVVEGVKGGRSVEGGIAFDDVQLMQTHCPPPGHCDFETNMCSWTNVGQTDQADWLRGTGASTNSTMGPPVDHTTNSSSGHYMYVDSTVGQWGDQSFLISEVFQPSTRGHCITFWYHMFGARVGTLRLHINDRKTHDAGNLEGMLMWEETGDNRDQWLEDSVFIKHDEPFWFVFVYQKGSLKDKALRRDVALDDITIVPFPCYSEPPVEPTDGKQGLLTIGLAVGFTLLTGVVICVILFILKRKSCYKNDDFMNSELIDHSSTFDLSDNNNGMLSDSFNNTVYDPSPQDAISSDA